MSWEKSRRMEPDPEFSTDAISSTQMDQPFAWLMGRYVDSLIIDGHRLTGVTDMMRQQDGSMHVVCTTDSGSHHLFVYNPIEEGPVGHFMIDNPDKQ